MLAISLPIFVYFKSVKGKKKKLDVNGYEIGKGYEEKDYSRKVISSNNINSNMESPQTISQNTATNQNIQSQQINMQNPNIKSVNVLSELDNGFVEYTGNNSDTKCPNCGRELLGQPSKCPYCKVRIR